MRQISWKTITQKSIAIREDTKFILSIVNDLWKEDKFRGLNPDILFRVAADYFVSALKIDQCRKDKKISTNLSFREFASVYIRQDFMLKSVTMHFLVNSEDRVFVEIMKYYNETVGMENILRNSEKTKRH